MELTIKSLKTWNSPDGGGFELSLYADGRMVARVYNGGQGGPNSYSWVKPDDEDLVEAYIESLPDDVRRRWVIDRFLEVTLDWLVDDLINARNEGRVEELADELERVVNTHNEYVDEYNAIPASKRGVLPRAAVLRVRMEGTKKEVARLKRAIRKARRG